MSKHSHAHAPEKETATGADTTQEVQTPVQETGTGGAGPETPKTAETTAGGGAGAQVSAETAEEKIAALEARLAEANDNYLRKAADFENFRKRMNREKQEAIDYANSNLLEDLIQTMDDFERAIKVAEETSKSSPEFANFYEGVSMIEKRLSSQLENKWGLKRFDSLGQPFDPNRHEAMMMDKSADTAEPVVAEEYYKGYILKDRVIRSAKVKVLMPENSVPAAPGTETAQAAGASRDENSPQT
jgi:molecular chaperone GrpE